MKLKPYPTFLIIVREIRFISSMVEKMIAEFRNELSVKSTIKKQIKAINSGPTREIVYSM